MPFYPPKSLKSVNFRKMKKNQEISSFNINVLKIMIILYCSWDMVHDGQTDRRTGRWKKVTYRDGFHVNFMKRWSWKFQNNEKRPEDVIILPNCTKNHDYMLNCPWDMPHDGCNYFSFWGIFCPFTPLTA